MGQEWNDMVPMTQCGRHPVYSILNQLQFMNTFKKSSTHCAMYQSNLDISRTCTTVVRSLWAEEGHN